MEIWQIAIFLATGSVAGLLAGVMGIGGGIIFVPVILFYLDFIQVDPTYIPTIAVSSSLCVILATISVSGYTHFSKGNMQILTLPNLIISGVVGSVAATFALRYIEAEPFKIILGSFQLFLGAKLFLSSSKEIETHEVQVWRFWAVGFLAGWVSGFFGVGGGMMIMPLLHLAVGYKLPKAVGTATGFMLFSVSVSLVSYGVQGWGLDIGTKGMLGPFYLPAIFALIPTSFVFSRVGALMASSVDAKKLKRGFGFLIVFVGLLSIGREVSKYLI
ncbi:MAG: sulfite exporter TauE/SafE family protein [SAR324 cluster bacterium]|nr:sulfite exporter TauE/SafE family protein [SAR324 cluster bacterium]